MDEKPPASLYGFSRHLFKSIIERGLTNEGFELYRDNTNAGDIIRMANFLANVGHEITDYTIEDLIYDESIPAQYKIEFPQRLEVHYLNKSDDPRIYRNVTHPVSWIEVSKDYLTINSQGIVVNPTDMTLSGNMSEARIAELLPYDFHAPKTKISSKASLAFAEKKKPVNPLTFLLEKPYLHTDKSYYYPNEMIWFRGYMNYAASFFRDSLSHVLYVDIVDTSNSVVTTKIFPIWSGNVQGTINIPPTVAGGDYILRAYTRWILNFDKALIFAKPIKILEYSETGRALDSYTPIDSVNGLSIQLEKDTFQTRECIAITVGIKDFLENFTPANFSISVTDLKQVVPAINEKTILTDFPIPPILLPDSLPRKVEFLIQEGIDFKGRFVTRNGKSSQGIVTVAQENTAQIFTITTEESGNFSFANLKLYDSANLSILAKTIKGKLGKIVLDSTKKYNPAIGPIEPLRIDVYKGENHAKDNSWDLLLEAKMLQEVTIEDTKLESVKTSSVGFPDFAITGEWIRANNRSPLASLQTKVPGLRVINGVLLLGPSTSFGDQDKSTMEPLLIIDGVPITSSSTLSESLVERLSYISPQEIERIEVFKYSAAGSYGSRGANGVISITTRRSNDSQSFDEKGRFQKIKVTGFAPSKKFYSPNYSTADDSHARADYRSTIYWNPNVSTNEDNRAVVSFYAADLKTQYRIVVEGITQTGQIVHGEKIITIDDN